MAEDYNDPVYAEWLTRLREINEAQRIMEEVIQAARECWAQYGRR